ncbi:MAG: EAL domain-containing protein [Lachnospiraceae bacterium]|nr:EAL domain-containing protein [Lachnospiraceae bacterium]
MITDLRYVVALLFIGTAGLLFYLIHVIRERREPIREDIKLFLIFMFIEGTANSLDEMSFSRMSCAVFFGISAAAMDFLLFYLYHAVRFFVNRPPMQDTLRKGWFLITLLDSLSMLLSISTGHAFTVEEVAGKAFWQLHYYPYMLIRLGFFYFVIAIILLELIEKIYSVPKIYWRQYLPVLFTILVLTVWDAFSMFSQVPINLSLLGNTILGMEILYFSMGYIPGTVFNKIIASSIETQADGILFTDTDDACIYLNASAKEILHIDGPEEARKQIASWEQEGLLQQDRSGSADFTRGENKNKRYLRVERQFLQDKRERKVGNLFRIKDRTLEREEERTREYQVTHDSLTGALNREGFYLEARQKMFLDTAAEWVILRINFRDFKYINNFFGSKRGDEILKSTANILRIDLTQQDLLARLYGDDFVILTTRGRYREERYQKILNLLSRDVVETFYTIYIHMGVYYVEDPNMDISLMCDKAALAIEKIKQDSNNGIAVYTDRMMEKELHEKDVINHFKAAMAVDEFRIYLQPQVTPTGKLVSCEALARWVKADGEVVSPDEFIPSLEKNGLIYQLDQYVWSCAARTLASWKQAGHEDVSISVNVSPRDIYYVDLYHTFVTLVEKNGIEAENLKIEFTETTIMQNVDRYIELIRNLRAYGFAIEMDDFGSGYSSLGILKSISADILKIDRSFIEEAEASKKGHVILQSVIDMASALRMPVVMEGVETREQVELLTAMGCSMFQGFYFAKPMSVHDFEEEYFRPKNEEGRMVHPTLEEYYFRTRRGNR